MVGTEEAETDVGTIGQGQEPEIYTICGHLHRQWEKYNNTVSTQYRDQDMKTLEEDY